MSYFSGNLDRCGLKRARKNARPEAESLELRQVLSGVSASFAVTQDWGTGFQGALSLTNGQTTAVKNWVLEFDYAAGIDSIWDAKIVSRSGDHYKIGCRLEQ